MAASPEPEANGGGVPVWTFADRLRKARRHAGLSQQELADMIGENVGSLSQWEADKNAPRHLIDVTLKVSDATGVPAHWLAGLERSRCSSPLAGQTPHRRATDLRVVHYLGEMELPLVWATRTGPSRLEAYRMTPNLMIGGTV